MEYLDIRTENGELTGEIKERTQCIRTGIFTEHRTYGLCVIQTKIKRNLIFYCKKEPQQKMRMPAVMIYPRQGIFRRTGLSGIGGAGAGRRTGN